MAMAEDKDKPLEWPVAAIWITFFICVTAVAIAMILT
jgi:hypothetical protein